MRLPKPVLGPLLALSFLAPPSSSSGISTPGLQGAIDTVTGGSNPGPGSTPVPSGWQICEVKDGLDKGTVASTWDVGETIFLQVENMKERMAGLGLAFDPDWYIPTLVHELKHANDIASGALGIGVVTIVDGELWLHWGTSIAYPYECYEHDTYRSSILFTCELLENLAGAGGDITGECQALNWQVDKYNGGIEWHNSNCPTFGGPPATEISCSICS